jgi:hypothetical protein
LQKHATIALILFSLAIGCADSSLTSAPTRNIQYPYIPAAVSSPSPEFSRLTEAPIGHQDAVFLSFPEADQPRILVEAYTQVHPPLMHLCFTLAEQGSTSIPHIKRYLRENSAEYLAWEPLLMTLDIMQERGYYDVNGDPELMDFVRFYEQHWGTEEHACLGMNSVSRIKGTEREHCDFSKYE